MHLANFRRGWENEHLATFLLSRIAFVASPVTVADDIGTDIFCTLFEAATHKDKAVFLPRSSIAVQIKSNKKPVDIAPKLDYLSRLEVPYYLGVVDQEKLTLELFSARFLPALLSWKPQHTKLFLAPVEEFIRDYRPEDANGVTTLLCHKVGVLNAHDDAATSSRCANSIKQDASAALQAIASRLNHEYVFDIVGGEVEIFAGPGSAQTFRDAFFKRLGEAYFTLSWLIDNRQAVSDAEIDAFVGIADPFVQCGLAPDFVVKLRSGLQKRRGGQSAT